MKLNIYRKRLLLLAAAFIVLVIFSTEFSPLSVFQTERAIAGSPITVGDLLTLVGLFGTMATLVMFFTSRRERRRK